MGISSEHVAGARKCPGMATIEALKELNGVEVAHLNRYNL
jgi:hypothetical protein